MERKSQRTSMKYIKLKGIYKARKILNESYTIRMVTRMTANPSVNINSHKH